MTLIVGYIVSLLDWEYARCDADMFEPFESYVGRYELI